MNSVGGNYSLTAYRVIITDHDTHHRQLTATGFCSRCSLNEYEHTVPQSPPTQPSEH
jgi:hypothetical protein